MSNLFLLNTRGIRAASEDPQRIKTAMDGGGSQQNRVRTANSQLKNEQGCSFLGVPAVNLCSRLVSVSPICKSAGSALRTCFISKDGSKIKAGQL